MKHVFLQWSTVFISKKNFFYYTWGIFVNNDARFFQLDKIAILFGCIFVKSPQSDKAFLNMHQKLVTKSIDVLRQTICFDVRVILRRSDTNQSILWHT